MKRNYSLFQKQTAYILLISFFLQNCGGGFDNRPLIPTEKSQMVSIQTAPQATEPLVGKELVAQGGHGVTFYEEAGELKANVVVSTLPGFSKSYEELKVYVEQWSDLVSLLQSDAKAQQRRIKLYPATSRQPAKLVIYKGSGLLGGSGNGKDKEKMNAEIKVSGQNSRLSIPRRNVEYRSRQEVKRSQQGSEGSLSTNTNTRLKIRTGSRKCGDEPVVQPRDTEIVAKDHPLKKLFSDIFEDVFKDYVKVGLTAGISSCVIAIYEFGLPACFLLITLAGITCALYYKYYYNTQPIIYIATQQYNLACTYETEKNYSKAFECYREAADEGHISAQYRLGRLYEDGMSVTFDHKKAVKWYKKADEQGHKLARARLAILCFEGSGAMKNTLDATKVLKELSKTIQHGAENGDPDQQSLLGWMYNEGVGIEKDLDQAFKWYEKAANQEYVEAQFILGFIYEQEKQDYVKAAVWYKKAAKQGYACAQYNMGVRYECGKGVKGKNYSKAREWYEKAANQGHVNAQYNLGWMYEQGKGKVLRNDKEAFKWYEKAANQGDAEAQFNLGWMYEQGQGVVQSDKTAISWYQKSADKGYANAQFNLGGMYQDGRGGVTRNDKEAFKWYEKAANQGYADAQFNLGGMYQDGRGGVTRNDKEAFKWYEKAANQGDADAQFNLGWMYEQGQGVAKNKNKARGWYEKAAGQGHVEAQTGLNDLKKVY